MGIWEWANTLPKYEGLFDAKEISNLITRQIIGGIISSVSFFQEVLMTSPTMFFSTEGFWNVYRVMVQLSIMVLALVYMKLCIDKIKGSNISVDDLISRTVIYILLVKMAPHLMIQVLSFFNRAISLIINLQGLNIPDSIGLGALLGMLVLLVAYFSLVVRLTIFYFEINLLFIFYTVITPLVLALRCSYKYHHIGNKLIDKIKGLLIIRVVHSILLLILGTIIFGVATLNPVMALGFQVATLSLMSKTEEILIDFLGGDQSSNAPSYEKSKKTIGGAYKTGKTIRTNLRSLWNLMKGG